MAKATKDASIGSIEFLDQPEDGGANRSWFIIPAVMIAVIVSAFFIIRRANKKGEDK